jgi:peptidoglycan/LPS O-acetylase OafA/YrhL
MMALAWLLWPKSSGSYWKAAPWVALYLGDFRACVDPFSLGTMLPTWSLAIEEQFYLLWPLCLRLMGASWKRALGLALLFLALRPVLLALAPAAMKYYSPLTRVDILLLGCVLALFGKAPRVPPLAWIFVAALPAVGLKLGSDGSGFLIAGPVVAVGSIALIAEAVNDTAMARLLSLEPLVWIGRRSYGLYLYHLPIFEAMEPLRHHGKLNFIAVSLARVAASLVVCGLSYRFIEKPILDRGVRGT